MCNLRCKAITERVNDETIEYSILSITYRTIAWSTDEFRLKCASGSVVGVIKKGVNGQSFASDVQGCTNIVVAGCKGACFLYSQAHFQRYNLRCSVFTLLCSCTRDISASLHKTERVTYYI